MIEILRKEDCCGCGACIDSCSLNAILWESDHEGFFYPFVDKNKCTNCGVCETVCPIINSKKINQRNKNSAPVVLGIYHKDQDVRFTSTSGGAFWGLAYPFIQSGGYVAGAIFTDDFHVKHLVTNSLEGLFKIKGSKYVQSDCRTLYRQVRSLLQKGEKVMATGCPCQMAALRQFLKNDYENLLVIDLICHSVPSPFAFERYVEYLQQKYKSKIVEYHPKNKEYGGWHNFAFKAIFENKAVYHQNGHHDYFTKLFVGSGNLIARPSCFECKFKNFPQPSDITIGDFWGIEFIDPQFDSPNGVSKIILNNEKGRKYYESLDCFISKEYSADISIFKNRRSFTMIQSVSRPTISREEFFHDLQGLPLKKCMRKYFGKDKPLMYYIKKYLENYGS